MFFAILLLVHPVCLEPTLDFLKHYEMFNVKVEKIQPEFTKYRKRSLVNDTTRPRVSYSFKFNKFDHQFHVVLNEKASIAPGATLSVHERLGVHREVPLSIESYYHGTLLGDSSAQVRGKVLADGTFDGMIHSPKLNNTYFVEPTSSYPHLNTNNKQIIYRFIDLDFTRYPNLSQKCRGLKPDKILRQNEPSKPPHSKAYRSRRYVDEKGQVIEHLVEQHRLRSMHCPLHIYIDHRFYTVIGNSNTAGTIEIAVDHVEKADAIFRSTSFDGQGSSNIGFSIAKITLFKTEETNPLGHVVDGSDSQDYLNGFSALDHSTYCLGVMFTVVDFTEGVLGLAWIANQGSLDAGICGKPYVYRNGTKVSFNTGIVSHLNYGKLIPKPMFTITVAHEMGHNFGSEHDNSTRYSCAPGGDDGNYIMFHLSGDGSRPNHFHFSSCSINHMYKILRERMDVCFQDQYIAFCSNARIDSETEECDCGTESTCESFDPCCNVFLPNSTSQCTLKSTSRCSSMVSRCCSPNTCDFIPASERELCSLNSDCTEPAYCNGLSASCPTPANLPDGTLCNQNLRVCVGGLCEQNVCAYHGYKDCYCQSAEDDCKVCCKHNETGECKPAKVWGFAAGIDGDIPTNGICLDENGRCDEKGFCRFLNGTYAKSDLIRLVKESAEDALALLANYWYYAVLTVAGIGFLIGMFVFIHRSSKPLQSMAYKDGRMAYVWFEARSRLAKIEKEIQMLEAYDPPQALPYPVAVRRIAYQFPTAPQSLYSSYLMRCDREHEVVKLLLLQGYPMRKLLTDDNDEKEDELAIQRTLTNRNNDDYD